MTKVRDRMPTLEWIDDLLETAKIESEKAKPGPNRANWKGYVSALQHVSVVLDKDISQWLLAENDDAWAKMDQARQNGNKELAAVHHGRIVMLTAMMTHLGVPMPEDSQ